MELVLQIGSPEALGAALDAGAGGVAVRLPGGAGGDWWDEVKRWQAAARRRGVRFYLIWDWLAPQRDWPRAEELLARAAALKPQALTLRDPGLIWEARRRYPDLPLHAAGAWGCQNSLGLGAAQEMGFRRVVLDAALSLKDLALMRRRSELPWEVVVPAGAWGFPGLCLAREYLGIEAAAGLGRLVATSSAPGPAAALATLAGLAQLGVEAVQVGWEFTRGEPLKEAVKLYRRVWEAAPAARPGILAAAREVVAAFGDLGGHDGGQDFSSDLRQAPGTGSPGPPGKPPPPPGKAAPIKSLWLEARDYPEAAALAREWRGPLVVSLTLENYRAFLPEYRRWKPRRLVWRLPPVMRESALTFYQKAMDTLRQAGYFRFIAGDWGAVALARRPGAEVYGDQTLGVRNLAAVKAAREWGVHRISLPPGDPARWQDLIQPEAGFWGYLSHYPPLAVWPREAGLATPGTVAGIKLRRVAAGEDAMLLKKAPENLEAQAGWLQRRGVAPLIVALPHSGLPRGRVPARYGPEPRTRAPRRD